MFIKKHVWDSEYPPLIDIELKLQSRNSLEKALIKDNKRPQYSSMRWNAKDFRIHFLTYCTIFDSRLKLERKCDTNFTLAKPDKAISWLRWGELKTRTRENSVIKSSIFKEFSSERIPQNTVIYR